MLGYDKRIYPDLQEGEMVGKKPSLKLENSLIRAGF